MLSFLGTLGLLISYLILWFTRKNECPESISGMVYVFPEKLHWIWTLWIWALALMILPGLLAVTPETWKFLAFLSIATLVFCGAMPLRAGESNLAHNLLGIASGILSQVCVALTNPLLLLLWIPAVILIILFRSKSTFISEITCWLCIVLVIQ
jgi:hypothetical protein